MKIKDFYGLFLGVSLIVSLIAIIIVIGKFTINWRWPGVPTDPFSNFMMGIISIFLVAVSGAAIWFVLMLAQFVGLIILDKVEDEIALYHKRKFEKCKSPNDVLKKILKEKSTPQ